MAPHFQTYTSDTKDTVQMRRKVLSALHLVDVPDDDLERILAFYAREIQQIAIPPPPLPPRLVKEDSDYTQAPSLPPPPLVKENTDFTLPSDRKPSPASSEQNFHPISAEPEAARRLAVSTVNISKEQVYLPLGPDIRMIFLSAGNDDSRSAIARTYLEFLRVWTANDSGRWIFRDVTSAGIEIDNVTGNVTGFAPLEHSSWSQINTGVYHSDEKDFLRAISNECRWLGTEAAEDERRNIHKAVRESLVKNTDSPWAYDCIFVWEQRLSNCLHRMSPSSQNVSYPESDLAKPLVVLLPKPRLNFPMPIEKHMKPVFEGVRAFLENKCNWRCPGRSVTAGSFWTIIVKITLHLGRSKPTIEKHLTEFVKASGWSLYNAGFPCEPLEWRIAIVGSRESSKNPAVTVHMIRHIVARCDPGNVVE